MCSGIAGPLADIGRQMRATVNRYPAHLMNHLNFDRDEARRLGNFVIVVISAWKERRRCTKPKATFHKRPIFGAIGRPQLAAVFRLASGALATNPSSFCHRP